MSDEQIPYGGSGKGWTEPGRINPNKQRVMRRTDVAGTDHGQVVYVLQCEHCGYRYGANGSDIHERRCPHCQAGKPGCPIDAEELRKGWV